MDCAGRHIEGYIWGELSCSITLESWAELLAAHSSARGLCAASTEQLEPWLRLSAPWQRAPTGYIALLTHL